MKDYANDWCFSGEVLTFRELPENHRFGGCMTLKGKDKFFKPCSLGVLIPRGIWNEMNRRFIGVGSLVEVAGHFETWNKVTVNGNEKSQTKQIADQLIG